MKTLTVGRPGEDYSICIGKGIMGELAGLLARFSTAEGAAAGMQDTVAVVTDENVWRLHGEAFKSAAAAAGLAASPLVLAPGEDNKSLEGLGRALSHFANAGVTRKSTVVAFGGGVVGDLCGFAASCYMRGVGYIQVPTTLLAQVDSSVGGKTAVNLPEGKNLAGTFYRPKAVFIDLDMLETLPRREFKCGIAEVIKYGAIRSAGLFEKLENDNITDILTEVIYECCKIKSNIVTADELEAGERILLNFGHTLGHAIEQRSGYKYSHGEAVAMGMAAAARLGVKMGYTKAEAASRLEALIRRFGLDTECPFGMAELLPIVRRDKKGYSNGVKLVLIRDIGSAWVRDTGFEELAII
jgi:3-dehydroquinate synthase